MCLPFCFVPFKREKVSLASDGLALGERNCYNDLAR